MLEGLGLPGNGSGLLDAIHQRWLERTQGGDGRSILPQLRQHIASSEPDVEACVELVAGYIAIVGGEYVDEERDEATVYSIGVQAVEQCIEDTAVSGKKIILQDIIDEIELAFIPGASISQTDSPKAGRKGKRSRSRLSEAERYQVRMRNLKRANEVRIYRAELKRKLAAQELTVTEILDDEAGSGMRLGEMLEQLPAYGRPKQPNQKAPALAKGVLRRAQLSADKRCSAMSPGERRRLLACLKERNFS